MILGESVSPVLQKRKLRLDEMLGKRFWPVNNHQSCNLNLHCLIPNTLLFTLHHSCLLPPWELQKTVERGDGRLGKAPGSLGWRRVLWGPDPSSWAGFWERIKAVLSEGKGITLGSWSSSFCYLLGKNVWVSPRAQFPYFLHEDGSINFTGSAED